MHSSQKLRATLFAAFIAFSFIANAGNGNSGDRPVKFSATPFKSHAFIENSGQYTGVPGINGEVLFGIDNPGEQIIFTKTGLNFVYTVPSPPENEDSSPVKKTRRQKRKEEAEKKKELMGMEKDKLPQLKFSIYSMNWEGCNPDVKIVAEDEAKDIYYFNNPNSNTPYKCRQFNKIIYKNLYNGIDLEYSFYSKGGIKYNFIIHPGADASVITMLYSGSSQPKLTDIGEITLNTDKGILIDHAPVSFTPQDQKPVVSSYNVNGNRVKLNVGNYDHKKILVIDPWTMSPGFTQYNRGYDISRRASNGDLYVYGGYAPFEVKKLDLNGALLWTYVTNPIYAGPSNNYYGDMEIDPSGDVYIAAGCCSSTIMKISGANATVLWVNNSYAEPWRLKWDLAGNRLIAAGYVVPSGDNICSIDPSTGNVILSATIIAPVAGAEIRSIVMEPNGKVHALHVSAYPTTTPGTNRLTGNSTTFINLYNVQSGYMMGEAGSNYASCDNNFYCGNSLCFHGVSGMAVTPNYIYTYDGSVIFKRDINNGAQLGTVTVPGGVAEQNSGIVIDSCGNIFVGTQNAIKEYDSTLTLITSMPMSGLVCDLVVGANGEIIATGDGFVTSVVFPCGAFAVFATGTGPLCNGQCTGTATANIFGGTPPFTYSWTSNVQTTQTITGLCAGSYTVTATDSTGATITSTVTITAPPVLTLGGSSTQTPCGASNGTATVNPTGGTGPYSYSWTGGQTTSTASGLTTGSYTCVVTDANGCTQQQVVNVPVGPAPTVAVSNTNENCNGQCFATSTAVGSSGTAPYTYSWSNGSTTATATGLCTGNYSCIVTDLYGCTVVSTSVTVTEPTPFNITSSVIQCANDLPNGQAVISVAGGTPGYTYQWSDTANQTTATATGLYTGTYTVLITDNNNCPDSVTVTLDICPNDTIHIPNVFTPNGDGHNDFFVIYNIGYTKLNCDIYNRWGNLIYSWDNPAGFWDGKVDGKMASDGTYYYILHGEKFNGNKLEEKGFLELLSGK